MNIQKLINEQKALEAKISNLRDKLYDNLREVPQNEDITILSDSPRVFTMRWSKLDNRCWSPKYYDFEKQIELVIKKVKACNSILDVNASLQKLIKWQKVQFRRVCQGYTYTNTYLLHPKLCSWLQQFVALEE